MKFKQTFKNIIDKLKKHKIIFIITLLLIIAFIIFTIIFSNKNKESEEKLCNIIFDTNGGSEINKQTIICGTKLDNKLIEEPVKEGFVFIGWYKDYSLFDFSEAINEDTILKAQFQPTTENINNIVKITLTSEIGNYYQIVEIKKGEKLTSLITPNLGKNYEFLGWYLNDKEFNFKTPIEDDITLIAKWKIINENVSQNNNEENSIPSQNNPSTEDIKCKYMAMNPYSQNSILINSKAKYQDLFNNAYRADPPYRNYDTENCYVTYRSDNTKIAKIENNTIVALKDGEVNIYNCINDVGTNKELACLVGHLSIKQAEEKDDNEDKTPKIKFDDIKGKWYKVGSNDETITFTLNDQGFSVTTTNLDSDTLKSVRDAYSSGMGGADGLWEWVIDYYQIQVISSSELKLTRGSNTITVVRTPSIVKTNKLELTRGDITIMLGDTDYFLIDVYPPNADDISFTITSSNEDIVSVRHNTTVNLYSAYYTQYHDYVTGKKAGTATITVKLNDSGITKSFKVTVKKIDVKEISLNKTNMELTRGKSASLIATISPENASDKSIIWTSNNENVASVDSEGNVTAKSNGTAVITATSKDSGLSASCNVIVVSPPLKAEASIGYSTIFTSNSIVSGISVKLTATGGSGNYVYYHIKLYSIDGTLIKEEDTNSFIASGYRNGQFYAEFEVRDSEGQTYTGTSNVVSISM